MIKRVSIAILGVLIGVSTWAGSFSSQKVTSDAKWVFHADLNQARATRLGSFLMNEIEVGKANKKMDKAKSMFLFDFCKAIHNVTAYGPAVGSDDGVMLIEGDFDRENLLKLLETKESHKVLEEQGHTIYSWANKDSRCKSKTKSSFGSFAPDGTLVLANHKDQLINALGVLNGSEASLDSGSRLNLNSFKDASFMAAALNMQGEAKVPPKAAILSQSDNMRFSVREVADDLKAKMVLDTQDENTALNVDEVARGMVSMALLHHEDAPRLAKLAQGVKIVTKGTTVTTTFSYPVDKIIDLYK